MNFTPHPLQAAAATLDQQLRAATARTAIRVANRLLTIAAWFAASQEATHRADTTPQRLRWPADAELEVTSGMVWVTQEGSLVDHCLASGERLTLPTGHAVWIGRAPSDTAEPARWRWHPATSRR